MLNNNEFILDLIYPKTCGICGKICKETLCKKCEMRIESYKINHIKDCRETKKLYFDYCINLLKYENLIREKIIDYKFYEKSYLYSTFAKIMLKDKKICRFLKERYDIIIPVPMHKKKERIRGYNQTELIAIELSKMLEIPIDRRALIKAKNNIVQSTLTKTERIKNVRNVFEIKDNKEILGKNIIIFDDIYTTGSTINECSRILKNAGAKEIVAVTLAKD